MPSNFVTYGKYALQSITRIYEHITYILEQIDQDEQNIFRDRLFDSQYEMLLFKQILETQYQTNMFEEFQEKFTNVFRRELRRVLPLENLDIELVREEFYYFLLSFKEMPICMIYPYEKAVILLLDDTEENLRIELGDTIQERQELENQRQYLNSCLKNPMRYGVESNRKFAKALLNRKGTTADIRSELSQVELAIQQVENQINQYEMQLEQMEEFEIQKNACISNLRSRLESRDFYIVQQERDKKEEEIPEEIPEDDLDNYTSFMGDTEEVLNRYSE